MIFTDILLVYDKNYNAKLILKLFEKIFILRSYTLELLGKVRITGTPTVGDI